VNNGRICMLVIVFSFAGLGTQFREEEKILIMLWVWEARYYYIIERCSALRSIIYYSKRYYMTQIETCIDLSSPG
jgi:hypothetical protein